tara:strand:- start:130 stop:546 length:417 start_codon:yes stop_codon:yes gene_type:complete
VFISEKIEQMRSAYEEQPSGDMESTKKSVTRAATKNILRKAPGYRNRRRMAALSLNLKNPTKRQAGPPEEMKTVAGGGYNVWGASGGSNGNGVDGYALEVKEGRIVKKKVKQCVRCAKELARCRCLDNKSPILNQDED